jgi:hypothetical protein
MGEIGPKKVEEAGDQVALQFAIGCPPWVRNRHLGTHTRRISGSRPNEGNAVPIIESSPLQVDRSVGRNAPEPVRRDRSGRPYRSCARRIRRALAPMRARRTLLSRTKGPRPRPIVTTVADHPAKPAPLGALASSRPANFRRCGTGREAASGREVPRRWVTAARCRRPPGCRRSQEPLFSTVVFCP